jgi:hypothetical protein
MNQAETDRFNKLYQRHLRLLKLQGKSQSDLVRFRDRYFIDKPTINPYEANKSSPSGASIKIGQ